MDTPNEKLLVGSLEECDLPELNIFSLDIRVDTGATTSSLHVDNIVNEKRDGDHWVSFDIHPDSHNVTKVVRRSAKVKSKRTIKSSNADKEQRYVIDTTLCLGGRNWLIEVTLTDRSNMSYLMLLGREAMCGRVVVDPELENALGQRENTDELNN